MLDTNVLVAAVLSRQGAPARVMPAWQEGLFELVVSPLLLDELRRVLTYPKLAARIPQDRAAAYVALLAAGGEHQDDPTEAPPVRSRDPDDDYLLALAAASSAYLITGDDDLLDLAPAVPVHGPADFLRFVEEARG